LEDLFFENEHKAFLKVFEFFFFKFFFYIYFLIVLKLQRFQTSPRRLYSKGMFNNYA